MDTKYTSDGRKVLVVGKLNSDQHIVQEIFISNGQEVPSGENFIVSSLHDAPSESWKEKNLRELEARYDKAREDAESRTNEVNKKLSVAESKAKQRALALLAFANNSDNEQLQTLHDFLAGEITHFFIDGYGPEIVAWDDNKTYQTDSWYGRMKVEGMKLVSLFGSSDGKLDYRLHQYRDGSGSLSKTIIPCKSYEDALQKAQQSLEASAMLYVDGTRKNLNIDDWLKIEGIKIPAAALEKYDAKKLKNRLARIEKLSSEIEEISAEIADSAQPGQEKG